LHPLSFTITSDTLPFRQTPFSSTRILGLEQESNWPRRLLFLQSIQDPGVSALDHTFTFTTSTAKPNNFHREKSSLRNLTSRINVMAINKITLPLRIVQTVFAVIVLGLTAYGSYPTTRLLSPYPARSYTAPASYLDWSSSPFGLQLVADHVTVAHWWSGYWHDFSPAEINFLLFSSVWSLLSIAYLTLVPLFLSHSVVNHKFGVLGAEVLTMIFWFAGFIALAVFLGNRVCFGHVCNIAKASVVFAGLEW